MDNFGENPSGLDFKTPAKSKLHEVLMLMYVLRKCLQKRESLNIYFIIFNIFILKASEMVL